MLPAVDGRGRCGLFVAALTAAMFAPVVQGESVRELVRYALGDNPSVLTSENQKNIADTQKRQAVAEILPTIGFSYSVSRDTAPRTKTATRFNRFNVSLRQVLYNGELYRRIGQSSAAIEQAQIGVQVEKETLMIGIAAAYVDILVDRTRLQLADQEVLSNRRLADRARQFFTVGSGKKVDMLQAQAAHKLAQTDRLSIANQERSNLAALKALVGKEVRRLDDIRPSIPRIERELKAAKENTQALRTNNAEMRQIGKSIDVAEANADALTHRVYPSLNLSLTYANTDYVDDSALFTDDDAGILALSLNWDFLSGLGIGVNSRIDEARLGMRRAQLQQQSLERNLRRQLDQLFSRMDTSIDQIPALQSLVNAREASLEANQQSYEAGITELVEVVNARRDSIAAKTNLRVVQLQLWLDSLQIKRLLGTISPDDFPG